MSVLLLSTQNLYKPTIDSILGRGNKVQNNSKIELEWLSEEKYGHIICYPRCTSEEFRNRLKELKRLHVEAIEFTGQKHIRNTPILGKGHVGVVVTAYWKNRKVALKIRRTDADRTTMRHEAKMLETANKVNVGPQLIRATKDFLIMECMEGKTLYPEWVKTLAGKDTRKRLCSILQSALEQAWKLDEVGLDHGELSHAPKHIIVEPDDTPCIVDFEAASVSRRVSNVTSLCQYLFLRSPVAEIVQMIFGDFNEDGLVDALRGYKKKRSREKFQRILEECKILKHLYT
jgi:putative serine/threonine protein kinase